jgi:hypothetical protein
VVNDLIDGLNIKVQYVGFIHSKPIQILDEAIAVRKEH